MHKTLVALLAVMVGCASADSPDADDSLEGSVTFSPVTTEPGAADLPADQVVATWQDGSLTYADLQDRIQSELRAKEIQYRLERYELQAQTLDAMVVEALLQAEAQRQGLPDINALLVVEVEQKVKEPSDAEVEAFYPVAKRQLRGASLDEARPFLVQELIRRAQSERYQEFVESLRAEANINIAFPYPDLPRVDIPIEDHDPVLGAVNAPVTIVQFAEYQCYYCNRAAPTLDQLLEDYDGKVRLVFKDFPLSRHGRALPAAIAAHCAGEQDKYWEMNRTLLQNQQQLEETDLVRYSREVGLDVGRFESCMTSGRYEPTIESDMEHGRQAGVEATPTFFVNGVLLPGAQGYDRFAALIDRELKN